MIIYNVTIKINEAIHGQWLTWMKEEHIPGVIATGCFTKAIILHLLETDDSEGPTYAIQYTTETMEQYHHYIETFAPVMRQKLVDKWGNQFIAFRSVMEVVN